MNSDMYKKYTKQLEKSKSQYIDILNNNNGIYSMKDYTINEPIYKSNNSIKITDDLILDFRDFKITGKELKLCFDTLMEITKEKYPEKFI